MLLATKYGSAVYVPYRVDVVNTGLAHESLVAAGSVLDGPADVGDGDGDNDGDDEGEGAPVVGAGDPDGDADDDVRRAPDPARLRVAAEPLPLPTYPGTNARAGCTASTGMAVATPS